LPYAAAEADATCCHAYFADAPLRATRLCCFIDAAAAICCYAADTMLVFEAALRRCRLPMILLPYHYDTLCREVIERAIC